MIDRSPRRPEPGTASEPPGLPALAFPDAHQASRVDAAAVYRHAATAMVVTDPDLRIVSANPAYARLAGLPEAALVGTRFPCRRPDGEAGPWESVIRHRGGQRHTVWISQSTLRDRRGLARWHVVTLSDISRLDLERRVLRHQAQHDPLTGLSNRSLFNEEFERAMARARRHARRLALLFVDLDRFKCVNDTLGHEAGDAVLREVARRLRQTVRVEDLVARWGGDEFVVVLDDPQDTAAAAGAARLLLAALDRVVEVEGHRLRIAASIGLALFPDDELSCADLLRAGDAAMYQAKQLGGGRVVPSRRAAPPA